jgi:hypothetical protein
MLGCSRLVQLELVMLGYIALFGFMMGKSQFFGNSIFKFLQYLCSKNFVFPGRYFSYFRF